MLKEGVTLKNRGSTPKHTVFAIPFAAKHRPLHIRLDSDNADLQYRLLDVKGNMLHHVKVNRDYFFTHTRKFYLIDIITPAQSTATINSFSIAHSDEKEAAVRAHLSGDTLLIMPEYPVFGHQTALAQELAELSRSGYSVDIVAMSDERSETAELFTEYDRPVALTGYNELRLLLQVKRYDRVIIHGFNEKIAQLLDGSDLTRSKIYIIVDGEEVLFDDFATYGTPYFKQPADTPEYLQALFAEKQRIVAKYAQAPHVLWVFPDDIIRMNAEDLLGISFKHHTTTLPAFSAHAFSAKNRSTNPELSLCLLSNMSDNSKYGVDIATRAILELSATPLFKKLSLAIYGYGDSFSRLTAPLKEFKNVSLHETSCNDSQRTALYLTHGIILMPRLDMSRHAIRHLMEALATGALVIAPDSAVPASLAVHPRLVLSKQRDFRDMAACIAAACEKRSKKRVALPEATSLAAILQNDTVTTYETYTPTKPSEQPLLSVVVPSYNCEKFLRNSVLSLVNHPLAHKLEVIIVNDGSKDATADIARGIIKESSGRYGSVIRLIDKENGGHGSTINAGIKAARGKYFRLMDGDDYFYVDNFVSLLKVLETEESDIVLTDYIEDFAITATKNTPVLYEFMQPGVQYDVEFMNYDGYGFWRWGPLLPTNTYKTKLLKEANFTIDEHCFYVDMEYNFITYVQAKTVVYYPLSIYNYYLGRPGQSMAPESMKRNVLHHEKVTLRLIEELYKREADITPNKRSYLVNRLIIPMCKTQYYITTDLFRKGAMFQSFDSKLKTYPEFYRHPEIAGTIIKLHRRSKGASVSQHGLLRRASNRLHRR